MKTLIFLITIIATTSLVRAEENHEVIWETEKIGGLNEVEVSPLGEVFYNTKDSIIQVRSVETGELIEEILFPNTARLDAISISSDGRLMAVSGQPKYIFIYDLVEKREVKRITTTVFERVQNGELVQFNTKKWLSSSISSDGTKVTGIAEGDRATPSTCWIVIDIASGEELIKETRLGYDVFNPEKYDISEWISSEFTQDGNYIVSQIDWGTKGQRDPDSIYIHDAKTFEIYDVVLNLYGKDANDVNIHKSKYIFTYKPKANLPIHIYDILSKEIFETKIDPSIWTFTFLRDLDYIIYGHSSGLKIYDYENDKTIYDYKLISNILGISLDDSKLLIKYHNKIYCLKTFLNETNIEQEYEEIVISPNPTSGNINLEIDCLELNIGYRIYNLDSILVSQNIIENQSGSFTIDFSQNPAGVYFLHFQCNNKMRTYKIIKEG